MNVLCAVLVDNDRTCQKYFFQCADRHMAEKVCKEGHILPEGYPMVRYFLRQWMYIKICHIPFWTGVQEYMNSSTCEKWTGVQ